ncbi:MAG: hypothetical protein H6Q90_6266 [Deltaproteobacteria bacterium]|nr:hypothetical protein [Deltaproteobacteria bacterium]
MADLGELSATAHAGPVRSIAAWLVVLVSGACGASHGTTHAKPTLGGIGGLARDHDTGDPVAKAEIHIRAQGQFVPLVTTSNDRGLYDLEHLSPGTYSLTAVFAGQNVDVSNIDVRAGNVTMVDIVFTLGRPDPVRVDYGDPKVSEIDRYRPKNLTSSVSIIEGTVNDLSTHQRVAGAVVTAVVGDDVTKTQQTVSDEAGRFRFEPLPPGLYSVSAYYSISGRGQIEVRRSGINVDGAEAVVVPLWIEMTR